MENIVAKISHDVNYVIEMKANDGTFIGVFCTTELQKIHVVEMFSNIKEDSIIKYSISSKQII